MVAAEQAKGESIKLVWLMASGIILHARAKMKKHRARVSGVT